MTDAAPAPKRAGEFHTEQWYGGADKQSAPSMEISGEGKDLASLFNKLSEASAAVVRLGKTGKFSAGNTKYDYATEADVLEPISAALANAGLVTIPGVVNQFWHDLPGKYGANRVVTVHAELLIGDTETGAWVKTQTFSTAANGDKASNAAFTTAVKYLLAKLVLVAFGDDADEFAADGEKAGAPKPGVKPKPAPKLATKKSVDKLAETIVEHGLGDKVKGFLASQGIAWKAMTATQLTTVETWVANESEGK